ncbi:conserved hypothetical protein [Neospora caninum Liverpool]|uniref:Alpha-1,3-mannosyl-glycoprotein 2-beta-N-acetylglucosaminyltransferase n=1 Tax=Neospora caninum (strain Liverpool) TaxID=572307 RepID=F0VBA2_NEOCL|nr:conserved hypothetical protein [Neospora caninum Liverpool]CBZ50886.1 conserved hypothetical protein [Neospora caninum Liverpool]CEL68188.1 TPA: Alpha-1,3-mannosyl-glycoprotein 2-beta-N-acetylglucosaminyltransferase [Neospora caninum Liverpool]|eukprot:XP_003880919.1 conserved hypothetical protein [Neospora caninum Liverpool]
MHVNPRVFRGFSTLRHRLHTQSSKKNFCSLCYNAVRGLFGPGVQARGRRCALLLLLVAMAAACVTFFLHSYYLARVHELEQALARASLHASPVGKAASQLPDASVAGAAHEETFSGNEELQGNGATEEETSLNAQDNMQRQGGEKTETGSASPLPRWWRRRPAGRPAVSGGVWDASVALSLFDLKEQIRASGAAANPSGEKMLHTHGLGVVLLLPSSTTLSSSVGRTLQDLLSLRNAFPGKKFFPVIISQPGSSVWQASAVAPFRVGPSGAYHMQRELKKLQISRRPFQKIPGEQEPDAPSPSSPLREMESNHLRWAAQQVFNELGLPFALFLDADLEFSPDFFSFLEKAVDVLAKEEAPGCASPFSALSVPLSPKPSDESAALQSRLWRTSALPPFGVLLSRAAFSSFAAGDAKGEARQRGAREGDETETHAQPLSCLVPVLSRCRKGNNALDVPEEWRPILGRHRLNEDFFDWQNSGNKKEGKGGRPHEDATRSEPRPAAVHEAAFEKDLEASLEKATPIAASEVASLRQGSSSVYRIFYASESELRQALDVLLEETLPSLTTFPRNLLASPASSSSSSALKDFPGMYKGVMYVELPGAQVYLHGTWPERFAGK